MSTCPQESSEQFARPAMFPAIDTCSRVLATCGMYEARLAQNESDRDALFRLRFQVFNLELNEGMASAYATGKDQDQFDDVCDHLMLVHKPTGKAIGTYRMQTGDTAARNVGYYSEQEFAFGPYEPLRDQVLEVGRACVQSEHRSFEALMLLWRGIAAYADIHGSRYVIGCSSATSQDAVVGSAIYRALERFLVPEPLRTNPTTRFAFPITAPDAVMKPPKLLRTYLAIGAQICGPPAIDREFGTIDFLTLLDLRKLALPIRTRLFAA